MASVRCLLLLLTVILNLSATCQGGKLPNRLSIRQAAAQFSDAQVAGRVRAFDITEASGLAASRTHSNILYTLNDAGNTPVIFAIDSTNGNVRARLRIRNAENVDWEDLAVGPCSTSDQGGYCIYIGDIGRHNGPDPADRLYRVREPVTMGDATLNIDSTLEYTWSIDDCETLMVDPQGEVYLISKISGGRGYFTQVPRSAWGSGSRVRLVSQSRIQIPTTDRRSPVGGDISPNGQEILIKTRSHVYYWRLATGESYSTALSSRGPIELPRANEPKGESVCWSPDANRYYTLSERYDQPLYYFVRQ